MSVYYLSELPYSDELWHYGTKGMKWGQRLYQNPDGTLTPLGKVHYATKRGVTAVGKAAASATKTVAKHEITKIKDKHRWMMSDDELKERIARLEMEKRYKDLLRDSKPEVSKGRKVVGEILTEGGKTIARGAFNKMTEKMFADKPDKDSPSYQFLENFKDQWNNNPGLRPSQEDLDEARDYVEALRSIEGINNGGGKKKKK